MGLLLATPGTFLCVDFKPNDCLRVGAKPSVVSICIWILYAAYLNSLCSKTAACMEVTLHDVCQPSKMLSLGKRPTKQTKERSKQQPKCRKQQAFKPQAASQQTKSLPGAHKPQPAPQVRLAMVVGCSDLQQQTPTRTSSGLMGKNASSDLQQHTPTRTSGLMGKNASSGLQQHTHTLASVLSRGGWQRAGRALRDFSRDFWIRSLLLWRCKMNIYCVLRKLWGRYVAVRR